MSRDGQPDLQRMDHALMQLRRFFETPAVVDDDGSPVELSTLLVLDAVTSAPDASTVRDIASRLDVAHSTASRLVTRSEQAGMVTRRPSTVDGREIVVETTDAGRELAVRAARFRLARLAKITDAWSTDEVRVFAGLLDRFASASVADR